MNRLYKKNDTVICNTRSRLFVTFGQVYTVQDDQKEGSKNIYIIDNDGDRSGYDADQFRLVTSAAEAPAFKAGDKVKVVRVTPDHDANGMGAGVEWSNSWTGGMDKYVGNGKTYTVDRVTAAGVRFVGGGEDGEHYGFAASSLELVVEPPANAVTGVDGSGKPATFATADLKPFQRVTLRNGSDGVVSTVEQGRLRVTLPSGSVDARMCHATEGTGMSPAYDIIEVYAAPGSSNALNMSIRGVLLFRAVDFAEQERKRAEAAAAVEAAKAALAAAEAAAAALN